MLNRSRSDWLALCRTIEGGFVPSTGKASTFDSGVEYVEKIVVPFELVKDGSRVLDVGCGNGRLPMGLHRYAIEYCGLDVVPAAVRFCRRAFAPFATHRFEHLDVRNTRYNPKGRQRAEDVSLPVETGWADLAIASSLFTHIGPLGAARRYIEEMKRATKPGGLVFTTWFRSPPNPKCLDERRVARPEAEIRQLLAGGEWVRDRAGDTTDHSDQWLVLIRR